MTHMTARELSDHLEDTIERVATEGDPVIVRLNDKDAVAIVSIEAYEFVARRLQEEEDRLDREAVRRAREEIAREGTIPYEKVRKELGLG